MDIYLCKPLQPLFSTVTAKVVNQQQGQTPFLSAAKRNQRSPQVQLGAQANSSTEIMWHHLVGWCWRRTWSWHTCSRPWKYCHGSTKHPSLTLCTPPKNTGGLMVIVHRDHRQLHLPNPCSLDAHQVTNLSHILCTPFPGTCFAVPTDGWMWAHVCGVPTADVDGIILYSTMTN